MLYMPATTLSAPVVLQGAQPVPLASTTRYYMVPQATTMFPTVPFVNTAYVYPSYGFVPNAVVQNNTENSQKQEMIQHVVHHHHVSPCSMRTCNDCCELCCPWKKEEVPEQRPRSRSCSPSSRDQQRCSRRDDFDRSKYDDKLEALDDKINRLRLELNITSSSKHNHSTETVDYYKPPPKPQPVDNYKPPPKPQPVDNYKPPLNPQAVDYYRPTPIVQPVEPQISYKQHYDPPKPRSCSRSRSRSRSRPRSASTLPREPWRSTNQNDYPWRDAHLPAYREATLARAQSAVNSSRTWKETTHESCDSNTQNAPSCHTSTVYAPSCHTSTVYAPSCHTSAVYDYTNLCTPCYTPCPTPCYTSGGNHSFYSDIPSTKTHSLTKVDSTQYHNLYECKDSCLHVIPKQGTSCDPPYLKIHNAPVTYLH
ncbi:unnamed protein product [Adineta steineri]|uniref:Uncharacterized protein n=2 Tax=Adineta steineri TaxID=433720 RepID=A0A815IKJ3_9BILA|nr:unnamed protein product [Adineta steineri]